MDVNVEPTIKVRTHIMYNSSFFYISHR
ncbi:hypothetical protein Zm00014a_043042 [Zea mays]|uniref:Uncharacterized protein n=1 Tax=Zea mays TaxID=4577 RepID=A0A3L6F1A9_MAIZE|nr:hypothetical protein Zm00014a_043042 [Zea mays]